MPPPGLLALGAALREADFDVRLEDLAFAQAKGELIADEQLAASAAARLAALEPELALGLSVMGATLPAALLIAAEIKRQRPDLPVLLGGPGTTGCDVVLLERFPQIDAIVRGEGEHTLVELLERLAAGADLEGVAGVTWRTAAGAGLGTVQREADRPPIADLGELPAPAWDLVAPIAEYKAIGAAAEDGLVPIDSGRGCVYDCGFCTIGRFWGRRSRPLPAARLAAEMLALEHVPAARSAYLCHDLFGADRRHALALCAELEGAGARVPFEIRARLDHLDDELIAALGRAGCYRVLLGIESADGAVRNRANKRCDPELDLHQRLDRLRAARITAILSLILGLPGEGDAELSRTLEFAMRASLRSGVQLSFHLVNPQPGCAYGEEYAAESRPLEGIPPDMALGAGLTEPERALIASDPILFSSWSLLTGLPGGEPRLRELHAISKTLGPLLERYPWTFAAAVRWTGSAPLEVFRELRATGRSFPGFARTLDAPLIDELLAWEQAKLRAVAARALTPPPEVPRVLAELLELHFDPEPLRALLESSATGRADLDLDPGLERHVAVLADAAGVRTLSVSAGVADLLRRLARRPEELARLCGLENAPAAPHPKLAELAAAGLLQLPFSAANATPVTDSDSRSAAQAH